jgi:hypothetical protein
VSWRESVVQRRETPNNLIVFLLEEVGRGRRGAGTFYEHLVEIVELEETKQDQI